MDKWFIGKMDPKEITFENLNDNINESFLKSMCLPYGEIVECSICLHPKTKQHLGIAKVCDHYIILCVVIHLVSYVYRIISGICI